MHGTEVEFRRIRLVVGLSTREGVVQATLHLPWKKAAGDRHDRRALAVVEICSRDREGQHRRRVVLAVAVLERKALHDVLLGFDGAVSAVLLLGKPLGVVARAIAIGHDVAHHAHVLRLGDDRLEVACEQNVV